MPFSKNTKWPEWSFLVQTEITAPHISYIMPMMSPSTTSTSCQRRRHAEDKVAVPIMASSCSADDNTIIELSTAWWHRRPSRVYTAFYYASALHSLPLCKPRGVVSCVTAQSRSLTFRILRSMFTFRVLPISINLCSVSNTHNVKRDTFTLEVPVVIRLTCDCAVADDAVMPIRAESSSWLSWWGSGVN